MAISADRDATSLRPKECVAGLQIAYVRQQKNHRRRYYAQDNINRRRSIENARLLLGAPGPSLCHWKQGSAIDRHRWKGAGNEPASKCMYVIRPSYTHYMVLAEQLTASRPAVAMSNEVIAGPSYGWLLPAPETSKP